MKRKIIVVGGANIDITATSIATYIPHDSNPARVGISFGGVGRNIAHNLCRLGFEVRFITAWADDAFARTLADDCRRLGMLLEPYTNIANSRSNYFVCVNNECGEMQAGAADMALIDALTPEVLAPAINLFNSCDAIVADCNISEETLRFIAANAHVPLYIDATSAPKAVKINAVLDAPRQSPLILKVNRAEAQVLAGNGTPEQMARLLTKRGAARVYITLGAEGACCHNRQVFAEMPAEPVEVVNATGAGDAFTAAVINAELQGSSTEQVLKQAITAATLTLKTAGTVI